MDKPVTVINVLPTAEGVTAVILAMLFACLIFPSLVKSKRQFYAAVVAECLIIVFATISLMLHSDGFSVFTGAITGFLQLIAIVMIVMSVGGLSARDLAGDIKGAYEVIRRGEDVKEVIIPIGAQREAREAHAGRPAEGEPKVYTIDSSGDDVESDKKSET